MKNKQDFTYPSDTNLEFDALYTSISNPALNELNQLMMFAMSTPQGIMFTADGDDRRMQLLSTDNVELFYDQNTYTRGLIIDDNRVTVSPSNWIEIASIQNRSYARMLRHVANVDPFKIDKAIAYVRECSAGSISRLADLLHTGDTSLPTQLMLLAHLTGVSNERITSDLYKPDDLQLLYELKDLIPSEFISELRKQQTV